MEQAYQSNTLSLFELICEHCHVEFDRTTARLALGREAEKMDLQQTMLRAARKFPFVTSSQQMKLRQVRTLLGHELPILITNPNQANMSGETQPWVLITDASAGGMKGTLSSHPADRPKVISEADVRQHLGLTERNPQITASMFESAIPCDEMRTAHLAHGNDAHSNADDDHHHHAHPEPWQRLLGLLRPERSDIFVVFIFAVVVGLLSLTIPLAVEGLVNTVAYGVMTQPLIVLSLVLFTGLAFASMLQTAMVYVVEILQQRIFLRMVADLSYRLPRVRIDAFDRQHGPELVNRFFDILTVQKVGAGLLLDGLAVVLQVLIGMIVLALYHPILLTFDVVLVVCMVLIVFVLGRNAVKTSIAESHAKYEVAGWLESLARHPVTFKLSGGAQFALDRADTLSKTYLSARRSHFKILVRQFIAAFMLQTIASTVLLGLGGWLVMNNQLTLGQIVAANLIVNLVVGSFAKLGKHLEGVYDLMAACDKLGYLIDLPLERSGGESMEPNSKPGRIDLKNVSFSYDGKNDVLTDLDLAIEPGQRVALLGPNGSGKSTLAELMLGLRTPTRGSIQLDGHMLRELSRDSLRTQIATVKGADLFEGTVLDNIRMGRNVPISQVREAAEAVGLFDDIMAMPEGLQTMVLADGRPLSSNQARRVALARAIIGNPRVVVLDETLDQIDEQAWPAIYQSFFGVQRLWTLILVTSNISLAEACDRVVRIDKGRIEKEITREQGNITNVSR